MNRHHGYAFAIGSACVLLLAAAPAHAASVTQVSRSTWGATGVPSYVNMYIYVPDQLADKPPIVVACHSCGTPVSGYVSSITGIQAGADKNGFILILPEATGRNCWDVGSAASLKHDGGGDTQAIAQMVKYALTKYGGDASRVYAMGGSSGAMMTQALMAVYPDVFKAGSARAGVPAGCWADGYDPGQQWSNNCAGGNTKKTAQQWGDLVRGMDPGYTGPRRRIQLFQGTADATINFNNMGESIKEWTNVLGLSETPTSMDTKMTSVSTYKRSFWQNACGYTVLESWAGQNGGHSMAYEQDAILAFFGLDKAGGADPEPDCNGMGTGGMGAGGASAGGAGGTPGGGGTGPDGGTGPGGGRGGALGAGSGGTGPSAGAPSMGSGGAGPASGGTGTAAGGSANGGANGGASGSGGAAAGTGGTFGAAGTPSKGGGPSAGAGGSTSTSAGQPGSAQAGAGDATPDDPGEGCGCVVGESRSKPASLAAVALGVALLAFRRRKRETCP